ncbi:multidrug effflux MFS transporter [Lacibacterium aquatile]|uniref:Bcr/CflA family efflux transporter n=1 Tax=Lacibacterium aquatile TaxID=1168082 RepID=A0ABW5DX53_9PROT
MADVTATPAKPDRGLLVLLTLLVAIGPLSTDMYLASLPGLGIYFSAGPERVQLTLSVFLVGFAVSQLIYGPLADRFGRRPVILGGLVLFALATAACAFAPSLELLIAARLAQAIGGCAGPVLGRAVVRDIYTKEEAARALALLGAAMSAAPALAPVLGGVLEAHFGWRANFVVLTVFAVAVVSLVWLRLPETNKRLDPAATSLKGLVRNYGGLITNRSFLSYAAAIGFGYSTLFCFISGSSLVLISGLGLPPDLYGFCFMACVGGYLTGTLTTARLARRVGVERLVVAGLAISAIGLGLGLLYALIRPDVSQGVAVVGILIPAMIGMLGVGVMLANAMAGLLSPFPHMAGTAAALSGFLQMAVASGIGILVAGAYDGSERPMMAGMAICATLGLCLHLALRPRKET